MDQTEHSGEQNPYYEIADALRRDILENSILPYVRAAFRLLPWLRSATLLVAQYWDDNAHDAVHDWLIFSELETPDIEAAFQAREARQPDLVNQPSQRQHRPSKAETAENALVAYEWHENGQTIPAFACYCREGGDQCQSPRENYTPYAIFRREQPDAYEVVGEKLRPWLDGIAPAWDERTRIEIGVEVRDGEAWKWLPEGPELCWELIYDPGRALPEMLAQPDIMALDTQADLPDDISPEGWEWMCRDRDPQPQVWRWLTLEQLLDCPGWELPVEKVVTLSHYKALDWLNRPYAWDDYGDWIERPDQEWPEVRERELKNAEAGEFFQLPWQQLRRLHKSGGLRKDLNYATRLFFERTLETGCPQFREKIVPRLRDQVQNPRDLRLIYCLR